MSDNKKRKDFTLSPNKIERLAKVAKETGISQSLIVDNLVGGFLNSSVEPIKIKKVDSLLGIKKITKMQQRIDSISPDFFPFPKRELSIITGQGGEGKTFLSLGCVISHILTEVYERNNSNIKVLAWFSEDSKEKLGNRFQMMCEEVFNLTKEETELVDSKLTIIDKSTQVFHFTKFSNGESTPTDSFLQFKEFAAEYDLIFLDPLIGFYSGAENDAPQAKFFMSLLTSWLELEQKTIIAIHHSPKEGGGLRGSSAFRDACRFAVEVKKYQEIKMETIGDKEIPVLDINGKKEIQEVQSRKHIREVRVLKDNHDMTDFINYNFMLQGDRFPVQILPLSVCNVDIKEEEEENYTVPAKRFLTSSQQLIENGAEIFDNKTPHEIEHVNPFEEKNVISDDILTKLEAM